MNQKLQESLMISSTDTNPLGIQSPKGSIGGSRTKKGRFSKDPTYPYFQGKSWMNAVLKGELPETRCNMGYAADNQYLYILGGQDLNKGIYSDLWRLNL